MELYEAIQKRYSVRAYQDKPVEQEKLDRILAAARVAPSGSNRQPWKFVVVRDAGLRKKLVAACCDQAFVGEAPVVIAMEHIALAATAEGLGTCWIGAFHQDPVRDLLKVPKDAKVIEVMTLGYPADQPRAKSRKSLEEIVAYDKFE